MPGITAEQRDHAKQLIKQAAALEERIRAIKIMPEYKQKAVVASLAQKMREAAAKALVDTLDADSLGVSDAALQSFEFEGSERLSDLIDSEDGPLDEATDDEIVRKIASASRIAYAEALELTPAIVDKNARRQLDTQLVKETLLLDAASELQRRKNTLSSELGEQADNLKTLANLPSFPASLFVGKEEQERAMAAISSVGAALLDIGGRTVGLESSVLRKKEMSSQDVWSAYEANRERVDTAIANVTSGPRATELPKASRPLARRCAHAVVQIEELVKKVDLLDLPNENELEAKVSELALAIREEAALALLDTVDVSVLREKGIRSDFLSKMGYGSIRKLLEADSAKLSFLKSEWELNTLTVEVNKASKQAFALMPCIIDEQNRPAEHERLIEALFLIDRLRPLWERRDAIREKASSISLQCEACGQKVLDAGRFFIGAGEYGLLSKQADWLWEEVGSLDEQIAALENAFHDMLPRLSSDAWEAYLDDRQSYNETIALLADSPRGDTPPMSTNELLDEARTLVDRVVAMRDWLASKNVPYDETQRSLVASLVNRMRENDADELLAMLDVGVLEPAGVACEKLAEARVDNLLQLAELSYEDLKFPMVRSESVKAIDSARKVRSAIISNTPLLLKYREGTVAGDELAFNLFLLQRVPRIWGRYRDLTGEIRELSSACKRVASSPELTANYFMADDAWKATSRRLRWLKKRVASAEEGINSLAPHIPDPNASVSDAWADYRAHRDERDALINSLTGAQVDGETPTITVELAKRAHSLVACYDKVADFVMELDIPSASAETKRAKELIVQIKKAEAKKRLDTISIDALANGGVRVGPLKSAGYISIGDLIGETVGDIASIQGVTWETARGIVNAVDDVKISASDASRVVFDFDDRGEIHTELLKKLRQRELEKPLRKTVASLMSDIEALKEPVGSLRSFPGYLASLALPPTKASRLLGQTVRLEASVLPLEQRMHDLSEGIHALQGLTDDQVWEWFAEDAASRYAEIEALGGGGTQQSTGDLPKTLVEKVASFRIDSTLMKSTLRAYQRFGVQYVLTQKRTLIGDEMGLGKTVEAIAALAHLASKGEDHFVVVCPLSVLVNWAREVPRHSKLDVVRIHGADREKMFNYWRLVGGVAITTYETVSRLDWDRVKQIGMLVIDEAHYIKNPQAKRTLAVRENLMPIAEHVLLMTGTPLENRLEEMKALISYLNPQVLRGLGAGEFVNPIRYRQALAPVYLRRRRIDVLDELPKRIVENNWCTMTETDKDDYLDSLYWRKWHDMRRVGWMHGDMRHSAKAERLIEICEEAKENGTRVLVFSYYLNVLKQVEKLLAKYCAGVITGKVPAARRQEIIDEFSHSKEYVLICQVTAGGVGLNIQAASIVVFCEPQIKPSMEEQAISRAYRMGQVRTVVVHKLLMDETVDERVQEILWEKRSQFNMYADESQMGQESLGVIDTAAISKIIEEERERYGIKGGATANDLKHEQGAKDITPSVEVSSPKYGITDGSWEARPSMPAPVSTSRKRLTKTKDSANKSESASAATEIAAALPRKVEAKRAPRTDSTRPLTARQAERVEELLQDTFTPRLATAAAYLMRGMNTYQIADEMCISRRTASKYREQVYHTLGARIPPDLYRYGRELLSEGR